MNIPRERFDALESLRGVCACLVVLYHAHSTGWIALIPAVRHGAVFVDFFFTLSGFVIAASYGSRLAQGFSIRRFMFLRLGRLYPLHFALLLILVVLEAGAAVAGGDRQVGHVVFGPHRSYAGLAANVLLVQTFGWQDTWNTVSWSISAEFWTYFIFAIIISVFARRAELAVVVIVVLAGVGLSLIGTGSLIQVGPPSLLRCLFSFGIGILTWRIYRSVVRDRALAGGIATPVELLMVICCGIAAGALSGPFSLFLPLLFAATILVFTRQAGLLSRLLLTPPFMLLGTTSYSIYMVQNFVVVRYEDVLARIGARINLPLVGPLSFDNVVSRGIIAPNPLADILAVAALAAVVAVAYVTYRFIEKPSRDYSRRLAASFGVREAEKTAPAL